MNQSSLKNMVILRNLPSNIIEEAIVILKSNKKAKKLEKIDKNKNTKKTKDKIKGNDYILKEAEIILNEYVYQLEERKNNKIFEQKKKNLQYKKLKSYAYISSFIIFLETILLIIR